MRTTSATAGSSSLPDASRPVGMAGNDSTSGMMNCRASTMAMANMVQPSRHDTSASFSGSAANEKTATAIPASPMTRRLPQLSLRQPVHEGHLNPAWS